MAQRNKDCAHHPGDGWRQRGEVRRWRFGWAKEWRSVLGRVSGTVFGALSEFVSGYATGAGDECAHLVKAGVQHLLSGGDAAASRDPPPCGKSGAAHDARGPDVAVDATLVAEAVSKAGFAEKFVKLRLVRRGNLGADFGNAGINVRSILGFSRNGNAHRPNECLGQFE